MTAATDPDTLEIPFRTIGAAFADYAGRHPDKTAITSIDQDCSLSFGELLSLTERVAARMVSDGIGRGDRVAVLAGECIEKLVLMFAAWRCGASACPFHAEIAPDHLQSILRTIDPALIVWRAGDVEGDTVSGTLTCRTSSFQSRKTRTDTSPGCHQRQVTCRRPATNTVRKTRDVSSRHRALPTDPNALSGIIWVSGCADCRRSTSQG